jgi:azurin
MNAFRIALPAVIALGLAADASAQRTVELAVTDDLRYSQNTVTAQPGESLRIVVRVTSRMPKFQRAHNFVLLAPGTDPGAFANEGATHRDTDFIAPALAGKVLAKTSMAGNGETVEVTLTVPGPGTYPFICTFPGHSMAGMAGTLVVQ